jgi:hypothetical protein
VSVKVVQTFACHKVDGVAYLRADYSLECYNRQWYTMAAYASFFLVFYVIGFPLYIGRELWSYRHAFSALAGGPGQMCKLAPPGE